jgi:hypothetical protein
MASSSTIQLPTLDLCVRESHYLREEYEILENQW